MRNILSTPVCSVQLATYIKTRCKAYRRQRFGIDGISLCTSLCSTQQELQSIAVVLRKIKLSFVQDSKADSIAEVFVASVGQVQLWQPRTPTDCMLNVERRWHQPAVQQIRQSLDQGKGVSQLFSFADHNKTDLYFAPEDTLYFVK